MNVVGGFTRLNKKVWKGVLRDAQTNAIVWQCRHVHSRPEYNARSTFDHDIWEYSALNCGKEAEYQSRRGEEPVGLIGAVNRTDNGTHRDDTKLVDVQIHRFRGRVSLREDGYRVLDIESLGLEGLQGQIILETKKDDRGHPRASPEQLARWLMAAVLLEGDVWGLTFRDPRRRASVDQIDREAIKRYLPKRKKRKPTDPFIRTVRDEGRRRYEVVGPEGEVLHTVAHRGQARKLLDQIGEAS